MIGIFYVFLASCGYATVALFGRWIFDHHLAMYTMLAWRFGGAALVFWLGARLLSLDKIPRKKKISCFLMGVFADTLQTSLFFSCVARVGASIAALLLYTFPFFVFLIQRFFFRQHATKIQWISLCISSIGCLLVIDPFRFTHALEEDALGIFFGLATGLAYAFYLSFGAYFTKDLPPISSASYLTRGAFLSFASIAFFRGELVIPTETSEWICILLMSLFATVIPLFCLVKGMQLLGASQTALLFTMEPIVTIFFAILFFNESLTPLKILGSGLILGAALLIQKKKTAQLTAQQHPEQPAPS